MSPSSTTCAPASSALSSELESVSESSGAISASASTRPTCRAPTVMRTLRVARPSGSSATPVSAGTASPSPAPQNASAIATRRFEIRGSSARATRPPASSAAPPSAAVRVSRAPGERPHSERRRGERAHDERADDRVERPDSDHEQHREEERSDERAEDEPEAGVGGQRMRSGAADATDPAASIAHARVRHRRERDQRERHLHDEDRPPVEELREHSSERRAGGGTDRPGRRPDHCSTGARARERCETA